MAQPPGARLAHIYRYPVKSLSPQPLERTAVRAGERLPHDRRFALAHGASRYNPAAPEWQPKAAFLALVRHARLAKLATEFDEETATLTISRDGRVVCKGKLDEPVGRALVEQFMAAFMGAEARGVPHVANAPGLAFTDTADPFVSIIGLDSVTDLERVARAPVDHRRFRANLYLEGLPAWSELRWIGRTVTIGGVRIAVEKRIGRCAAIEVDPGSGERDLALVAALRNGFGHTDMGVYGRILDDGTLCVGDPVDAPG